jgi:hypothetical protein
VRYLYVLFLFSTDHAHISIWCETKIDIAKAIEIMTEEPTLSRIDWQTGLC